MNNNNSRHTSVSQPHPHIDLLNYPYGDKARFGRINVHWNCLFEVIYYAAAHRENKDLVSADYSNMIAIVSIIVSYTIHNGFNDFYQYDPQEHNNFIDYAFLYTQLNRNLISDTKPYAKAICNTLEENLKDLLKAKILPVLIETEQKYFIEQLDTETLFTMTSLGPGKFLLDIFHANSIINLATEVNTKKIEKKLEPSDFNLLNVETISYSRNLDTIIKILLLVQKNKCHQFSQELQLMAKNLRFTFESLFAAADELNTITHITSYLAIQYKEFMCHFIQQKFQMLYQLLNSQFREINRIALADSLKKHFEIWTYIGFNPIFLFNQLRQNNLLLGIRPNNFSKRKRKRKNSNSQIMQFQFSSSSSSSSSSLSSTDGHLDSVIPRSFITSPK